MTALLAVLLGLCAALYLAMALYQAIGRDGGGGALVVAARETRQLERAARTAERLGLRLLIVDAGLDDGGKRAAALLARRCGATLCGFGDIEGLLTKEEDAWTAESTYR